MAKKKPIEGIETPEASNNQNENYNSGIRISKRPHFRIDENGEKIYTGDTTHVKVFLEKDSVHELMIFKDGSIIERSRKY